MIELNRTYFGDCRDVLRQFIADGVKVHCVVTSPPYWGLRKYMFDKATILRYDLSIQEREFVLQELKNRGIQPRLTG